jgi:hypothetical protein
MISGLMVMPFPYYSMGILAILVFTAISGFSPVKPAAGMFLF